MESILQAIEESKRLQLDKEIELTTLRNIPADKIKFKLLNERSEAATVIQRYYRNRLKERDQTPNEQISVEETLDYKLEEEFPFNGESFFAELGIPMDDASKMAFLAKIKSKAFSYKGSNTVDDKDRTRKKSKELIEVLKRKSCNTDEGRKLYIKCLELKKRMERFPNAITRTIGLRDTKEFELKKHWWLAPTDVLVEREYPLSFD